MLALSLRVLRYQLMKMKSIGENKNKNSGPFALRAPVEETKDLIAVHNATEKNVRGLLGLGGLPMPSSYTTRHFHPTLEPRGQHPDTPVIWDAVSSWGTSSTPDSLLITSPSASCKRKQALYIRSLRSHLYPCRSPFLHNKTPRISARHEKSTGRSGCLSSSYVDSLRNTSDQPMLHHK